MAPRVTKPSPPRKPRLIDCAYPRCTMGENADPSEDEVIAMPRPVFFSHGIPNLVPIEGGRLVDARVAGPAEALLQACRAAGLDPVVTSAYRSPVRQTWILACRVGANMLRGLSPCKAWRATCRYVALPGRSEHALGVALDISCGDGSPGGLEGIQDWLFENSWRFGFIRRYPPRASLPLRAWTSSPGTTPTLALTLQLSCGVRASASRNSRPGLRWVVGGVGRQD